MNILICSAPTPDSAFVLEHLQDFLSRRGVEPVILSFPDLESMAEYMSVSPDAPDALFFLSPALDTPFLDCVQRIAEHLPRTDMVLIGNAPEDVERLFSMGILYFMYPDLTQERFFRLEHRLAESWFVEREKYYVLENRRQTVRIAYSDILYVMSDRRQVIIHQPNGRTDSLYCKLDEIEQQLDERFLRCHQSFLINLQYVRGIDTDGFSLIGGTFIPISQKRYWASKRRYVQYIKAQG